MRWAMRSGHDPERDAAAYLAGEQSSRARSKFETHLLDCEECWTEVRLARMGRAAGEWAREMAPPGLKEQVRAAVVLSPERRRRAPRALLPAAAVLMMGALSATLLLPAAGRQPEPIAAALSAFRSDDVPTGRPSQLPAPDLTGVGLRLMAGGRTVLGSLPADVFSYQGPGDQRLFLYIGDSTFPDARNAVERSGNVHGWRARDDGVSLVCADRPISYLLMSTSPSLIDLAEEAMQRQGVWAGS